MVWFSSFASLLLDVSPNQGRFLRTAPLLHSCQPSNTSDIAIQANYLSADLESRCTLLLCCVCTVCVQDTSKHAYSQQHPVLVPGWKRHLCFIQQRLGNCACLAVSLQSNNQVNQGKVENGGQQDRYMCVQSTNRTQNLLQLNHKQLQSLVGRLATMQVVLPGCESFHLNTQQNGLRPKSCCNFGRFQPGLLAKPRLSEQDLPCGP